MSFYSFSSSWLNNNGNNNIYGASALNKSNLPNQFKLFEPDSTKKKTGLSDSSAVKLIEPDTTKIKVKLTRADSIKAKFKQDSLHMVDSLSKDSTARIEHFKYVRTDKSFLSFRDRKRSSFYVYPSQGAILRNVSLDSAKTKVTIKELVAGNEIRPSIQLPLDEYIKLRLESIKRDQWDVLGYDYKIVEKKKDFGQLITDITNIDIPLPSSPLLSIFGTPKITIKINGQVDIRGAWRNETTDVITTSALGNTRNEPDFKQTVQLNLSGTIGDKLNITADWNTERQFQYENQLKLRYLGYEDEIIQSVEAGNVSLQTSPLVGGSEALFGVKAQFKMGPFSLTALASQKKSEMKEVSVSGGSKAQTFEIRAWNYSQNHYFVLPIYADPQLNLFNNIYGRDIPFQVDSLIIKQIEVWKSYTGKTNGTLRKANAFINLNRLNESQLYSRAQRDSTIQPISGELELGNFSLLTEGADYEVDAAAGIISFKTQIQEQDVIGAAIRIEGPTRSAADDIFIGEFLNKATGDSTQRLVLKLIKPKNLQPKFKEAWKLQLKNIYPIGGRNVKEEGFKLDIKYRQEGNEPQDNFGGKRFLEMFGLDKTDASKTSSQPDGAFDFNSKTFRVKTGELVFPTLQPFGRNFPTGSLPDSLKYQAVYDTLVTFAQQDKSKDKFIFTGEFSAETSSIIQIGFSCVENSVKVLLNNNPLTEGVDYSVDYNLGQVVIRNEAALVPGANLKVTYEQNDLFALASKTLLGFRGIYEVNKETSLGFSYLNLNQETLSDKVKIGEEPLSNSILGLDFRTNVQLPFITNLLDKVISTSAPSNLSINAEYAYINPDPNTKKSTIASDQNKSIAYVDDFEGAKKTIPLGTPYGSWKDISIPTRLSFASGLSEAQLLSYKSKAFWYNFNPPNVTVQNIYGNRKQVARDAAQISVLDFEVRPDQPGTFNIVPKLSDRKKNFAGIMKPLSTAANNLKAENIEFIEFWVNIPKAPKNLKLYIDLGQISEEVYQDNRLSTEDKNENDAVDPGEDTGIDGLKDVDEPGYNSVTNPDPNHDNYFYQTSSNRNNTLSYFSLNGTEGNIQAADVGRIPDTEDLNRNRSLDKLNSFFRYTVAITDTSFTNPFLKGSSANGEGWYLFQIPLKDATYKEGSPSLSVVETIRFFVEGVEDTVRLRFAEMNLVGNQWQKLLRPPAVDENDEVLTVSVVNVEDNPLYNSPTGVVREKDRTRPDQDILKNEQSLDLVIKNLRDGDKREIVKYLSRPLDVFNYKDMKLFIHGDMINTQGSVSYYKDEKDYGSEVYMRFGSDSLNYYEYRQPVKADWNEVYLKFAELTAIKQRRDSSQINNSYTVPVPNVPGHFYGVQGNPTLTRLSYFTIGILNPKDKGSSNVSGSIWINEMRVLEAEQTPGWAYSATGSLSLADLMRVNFNVTQTDPYYHSLADRFGSREEKRAWGVSMDLDLLKLIPVNLSGSNFRITYSRNESNSSPLYIPSTDIKIEEAQASERRTLQERQLTDPSITNEYIESRVNSLKESSETVNMTESWSLSSVRFKIPTELWYVRDLVNNLSFSFNYNRNVGRTPTLVSSTSWVWNASANYSVTFSRDLYFKPIDIPIIGYLFELFTDYSDTKVYFTPQSFTTSLTANRKRSYTLNRGRNSLESVQRDFTTTRGAGFTWTLTEGGLLNPSFSYNFDFNSTLAHLLAQNNLERSESEIWSEIFNGVLFGKDYMFKQNFDLKFNPKLPTIFNLDRFISVDGSYSVSYQWQNNFQQAELGKSAGYSNRISARLNIRLKSIFDPLFQEAAPQIQPTMPIKAPSGQTSGGRRSGRDRNIPAVTDVNAPVKIPGTDSTKTVALNDSIKIAVDSTGIAAADSLSEYATEEVPSESIFTKSLSALKYGVKYLLFDYDQISINFSQSSSYAGGALKGVGTGFNNFWGFVHDNDKGASRAFVLGLSNDPGPRVARANIQDIYTHRNDLELKTQRPLWEGASIDITWKIGWGMNKNISMTTDSVGLPTITNIQSTGTLDRSFMSFPPVLIFSFLDSGIKKVSELYDPTAKNPNASLADAFINGFETFSLLSKIPILQQVANYIPRPNWTFSWNGLERLSFLSFARRVSINHAYSSGYSEGWRITPEGDQEVQTQRIEYGFTPLIGVTMDFNELLGGTFQSSVRYTTKSGFSLGSTTRNITETFSRDISITASYLKSGFDFPLFGISLKNDLEISLSFTSQKTSSTVYDMDKFSEKGKPLDGKTNTVIEPKIRYVMSSRVTLSIFYRRTSIEPEGSSPILPVTTNEAGVDVRISIQ